MKLGRAHSARSVRIGRRFLSRQPSSRCREVRNAAGKLTFYNRMLAELCQPPLNETARRRLANIPDLTPGDFHTVRQAMYYLGSSAGDGVTHDDLLSALELESRAKRQGKSGNFGFSRE